MADKKISELISTATTALTDLLALVQGAATKKVEAKDIAKIGYQEVSLSTSATYSVTSSDLGKWIRLTNSSQIVLNVPNDSTPVTTGTTLNYVQAGDGKVTISSVVGVTINKPTGYNAASRAKGSAFMLIKVGSNEWDLIGDLEAL